MALVTDRDGVNRCVLWVLVGDRCESMCVVGIRGCVLWAFVGDRRESMFVVCVVDVRG